MFNFFNKYKKLALAEKEIVADEKKDIALIAREFERGFDFIRRYPKSVSFFGSARFTPDDTHYKEASTLAHRIVKELGYAVITGGGPGIMEAANKGAFEAQGESVAITITLSHKQHTNKYVKSETSFSYFFVRKTMLTFAAEAYIFSPGGFGTLDEFFDIITLIQTKKIPRIPIILFGRDYWQPLDDFIRDQVLKKHHAVNEEEVTLYRITDDHDEIIDMIRKAPISNWWKNFER